MRQRDEPDMTCGRVRIELENIGQKPKAAPVEFARRVD